MKDAIPADATGAFGAFGEVGDSWFWNTRTMCNLSNDQFTLVICCMQGSILPSYIGIIRIIYKDPYEPISIMECHTGFERCSPGFHPNTRVKNGSLGPVEVQKTLPPLPPGWKIVRGWYFTILGDRGSLTGGAHQYLATARGVRSH